MAISLARTEHEIQEMPLVELVYEILKARKEPMYFRDIMQEIQELRHMTDEQVAEVIARVFTEINVDGRFVCIGHNVWGLNRWYPTDRNAERLSGGKKFIRKTGDAFGDEEDDEEDYEEDVLEDDMDYDEVDAVDEEAEFDEVEVAEDEDEILPEDDEYDDAPLFDEDEEVEEDEED
ncbi:DNA-directed RNA polymerase subunit delta [Alicyclobacillus mali]|uniref:Probable DNA-directed RNA polymerase subunit delta n=1 Tax=Alicyclobacillus mali (ex Roth et al. 2021) TaxID=1123961 RepID=A0ABS0EZW4_9BACL|nr:DNA-directed RNA polymerase subunit delta [Alicyclobacillus mali (ex Roth et al. 2021)]MBF8376587.1 DNA-directed RNA polymerase subunit delta [Alicyclobacillus mali (ex Roth et al. 2021)]MCL6488307.1 DNA-directed RNA polymerase subunit delta [Alicyclobacillus mali (ex Roth et al. 2021)]